MMDAGKKSGGRKGAAGGMVAQRQRRASGSAAQLRPVRRDGWTPARRKLFMEALAATCNVAEAARAAGKSSSSAYAQKQRDPGFAREWQQALCVAYDELEALLLRQSLFGTEQEEIVLDGEGAVKSRKVKRDYPLAIGLRLLLAHAAEVAEQRRVQGIERPDGEDAILRLRAALEAVRKKGRVVH
ncbi:hypothetical protein [Sphingobium sp. EM0848]|uniref:hypothetical protein n=1 Tax=Sphingobium sp. EM0848 TaxID=2743473 RepID=UPI002101C774|nr:hypothetical protein [Sphingobium sp. EM0848]